MKKTLLVVAALIATQAMAQEAFTVSTGDAKGGSTYSKMFRELAAVCSKDVQLAEVESKGSLQNMDNLTSNKVNAAIVQSDFLSFTKATDPAKVANIKTLVTLYPEELHFIARGDVKKEGGYLGGLIGGKDVQFKSIADLAGRQVGAVGGSVLSGRVVAAQSGLNFQIVEFPDNNTLKDALLTGKVDTILVVGGAPHALVGSLDQRFRLLAVSPEIQKKVSGVYSATKLSYSNLNQAGIDALTTQSQIVTRTYRSPAMINQLTKFRTCFTREVPNLQDKTGSAPKWQLVDINDQGKWEYYQLGK